MDSSSFFRNKMLRKLLSSQLQSTLGNGKNDTRDLLRVVKDTYVLNWAQQK
jgi:hypothetical protein